MTTINSYSTPFSPTWCPGCGNFGIWLSLKNALSQLELSPSEVAVVFGVGCHGNMRDWLKVYGVEGLHGRTLPLAQGIKLANHHLNVIAVAGDGDCLGEGGNHFLHAARRNPDVTLIIHDNQLYALTTGQASPTAKQGFKTKSTPLGVTDESINPLTLALVSGATFVARGFAGDPSGLAKIMAAAIKHKGFSVVDILQPCVTFDKIHTYPWYRERIYDLATQKYQTNDRSLAIGKALEWGEHIPVGIFFEEERETSEEREIALKDKPLIESPFFDFDLAKLLAEFS